MELPNPFVSEPPTDEESRWVLTPSREDALFRAITLGDDLPLFLCEPSEEFLQCTDK